MKAQLTAAKAWSDGIVAAIKRKVSKPLIVLFALFMSQAAFAGNSVATDDLFYEYWEFINDSIGGGLGVGLALMAFLIGAGIAAVQMSAMPMLVGIMIAIGLGIGDDIITGLVLGGAMLPFEAALQLSVY